METTIQPKSILQQTAVVAAPQTQTMTNAIATSDKPVAQQPLTQDKVELSKDAKEAKETKEAKAQKEAEEDDEEDIPKYKPASGVKKFWVGFASFCLPGLGQMINGEWLKGIGIFVLFKVLGHYGSKTPFIKNETNIWRAAGKAELMIGLPCRALAAYEAARSAKTKNKDYVE